MSDTLALRLRDHGLACRLEARDRLAIVIPGPLDAGPPLDREARLRVLQLLRAEGFTHVALELDPDGASLPGA
jgi:hypothetical protein